MTISQWARENFFSYRKKIWLNDSWNMEMNVTSEKFTVFNFFRFTTWKLPNLIVYYSFFSQLDFYYLLASLNVLMARKRWTAVWLTVQTGMAVNAPPRVSVQNVLRTFGSGLKLEKRINTNSHSQNLRYPFLLVFHRSHYAMVWVRPKSTISPALFMTRQNLDSLFMLVVAGTVVLRIIFEGRFRVVAST